MSIFWQFFDSQMAIFRRARFWVFLGTSLSRRLMITLELCVIPGKLITIEAVSITLGNRQLFLKLVVRTRTRQDRLKHSVSIF